MVIPAPGTPGNPSQFTPGEFQITPATPGAQLIRDVDGKIVTNSTKEAAEAASKEQRIEPPGTISLTLHTPEVRPGKGDSGVLRYPRDPEIKDTSDYVVFSFFKYQPPFGGSADGQAVSGNTATSRQTAGGYANYQSSNDRTYANPSPLKPIILYMPEDIQAQYGAGWNGAGFGAGAIGMMNLAGSMTGQKDVVQVLQAGEQSISGALKATAFNGIVSAINAAAGANISLNQALGTITGTIINPNVELAYEAPKLRTFSLKFIMTPRSSTEATEIKKICNRFKKAMLPQFGGQAIFSSTEAANLITIPDLCQVSYMNGNTLHPFLPQYKLCGITDVNVNYTAAGAYATMNDGSPVSTELTVSFLESKLIFSDEIQEDGPTL